MITPIEIARLVGVTRSAVSNWRKRYDDFPKPIHTYSGVPVFDRAEVLHWLAVHEKIA